MSVACVACSAEAFDCSASAEIWFMVWVASVSDSIICATSPRSSSAVLDTSAACACTLPEACATWPAIRFTPCSTLVVSSVSALIESATVPITSWVTGARTVRSRCESRFTDSQNRDHRVVQLQVLLFGRALRGDALIEQAVEVLAEFTQLVVGREPGARLVVAGRDRSMVS